MHPTNVDPRRPDKVQRYKPPTATGANGQEDLTPDYMNILGQRTTTTTVDSVGANGDGLAVVCGGGSTSNTTDFLPLHHHHHHHPHHHLHHHHHNLADTEDTPTTSAAAAADESAAPPPVGGGGNHTSNNSNLGCNNNSSSSSSSIQYGGGAGGPVLIDGEQPSVAVEHSSDGTAKHAVDVDMKDLHSTPSRNDRFKVVKIASLEPFKRGRWKCMDYMDEAPPALIQAQLQQQPKGTTVAVQSTATAPPTAIPIPANTVYLQTQSLPQQQIQQMLVQSGYTNGTPQFFQNLPAQMLPAPPPPQTQFYYSTAPPPPAQYPAGATQYFAFHPQNVQFVPASIVQPNQNSAFVTTSNFQQSQTYGGATQPPLLNGHAYTTNEQQPQQQQITTTTLPTQAVKNVILTQNTTGGGGGGGTAPQSQQAPLPNNTTAAPANVIQIQNPQYPPQTSLPPPPITNNTSTNVMVQPSPVVATQASQTDQKPISTTATTIPTTTPAASTTATTAPTTTTVPPASPSTNENPATEGTTATVTSEGGTTDIAGTGLDATSGNSDGTSEDAAASKSNAANAVNAIDNKIEQAMDLVKSHLMYTVREEVEVLKEKIAELMDKIQQLENENNFLRSQIPKSVATGMIFSMCGLMMRLKWCAWVALYCSCISFANSRLTDDSKQVLSSFMLSISAIIMTYLQNPQPMTPPWASAT